MTSSSVIKSIKAVVEGISTPSNAPLETIGQAELSLLNLVLKIDGEYLC